jgi:hypothetical protein
MYISAVATFAESLAERMFDSVEPVRENPILYSKGDYIEKPGHRFPRLSQSFEYAVKL